MHNRVIVEDVKFIVDGDLPWTKFRDKTILVTGANGFIPAYMVETLLYLNDHKKMGIQLVAMVRNLEKAKKRFSCYLDREDLEWLIQDASQPPQTDKNVDVIIHAASQASPKYYSVDPVGTLGPNVSGTAHLLEFAQHKNSENFLFFSSGEVYGDLTVDRFPVSENVYGAVDPLAVRSCYAEGKRAGEALCTAWHHQHQVPVKIVRPFHTYGPGMSMHDGRVHADFVGDIVAGRDIVMKSDGTARRAYCYLADAVLGIFTVMLKGENGEAYNIGNNNAEMSVAELAEKLVALFPSKGLKVVRKERRAESEYVKSLLSRNSPATQKAQTLGWKPVTGIAKGFLRTVRSYE